ncbi:MAG: hypothetical protein SO253_04500 [Bacilli bacterium]|nr:hypothetical protein [Bacilli bacterium]
MEKWGKGIPDYNEEDLMTAEDLYHFGIEVVGNYMVKEGYKIYEVNKDPKGFPSIAAGKDDQLYFVLVYADIAKNIPTLEGFNKYKFLNHSQKFNAIPLFASCSFGSSDPIRFEKGLALKNDGYYCNFTGLQDVKPNLSHTKSLEYLLSILNLVCLGYENKDYQLFSKYIADNCVWYSEFSKNKHVGKKEIDEYYNEKFIACKNVDIDCKLCIVGLGLTRQYAIIMHQIKKENSAPFLCLVKLNEEGLIIDIRLEDYSMKPLRF